MTKSKIAAWLGALVAFGAIVAAMALHVREDARREAAMRKMELDVADLAEQYEAAYMGLCDLNDLPRVFRDVRRGAPPRSTFQLKEDAFKGHMYTLADWCDAQHLRVVEHNAEQQRRAKERAKGAAPT